MRPRGFSLFELVVAFGLLMLVMLITYRLMVPGLRAWTAANQRSQMQQNAFIGVTRIAHELQQTCIQSVKIGTYDDAGHTEPWLAFLSPFDHDTGRFTQDASTGAISWQEYHVFYVDASGRLYVGWRPLQRDSTNAVINQLPGFSPNPTSDRIISRSVSRLDVHTALIPGGYDPFNGWQPVSEAANPVYVECEVHDDRDREHYTLQTSIWALLPTN